MRRESSRKRSVVLLSGGMDSAVAGAMAREKGYEIYALSFDYGQRHRVELKAARKVAAWLGAREHKIVKIALDKIGGSALTAKIAVPKNRKLKTAEVPVTYVPGRNLIFLAVAAAWAEVLKADRIVIGANAIDFSGYPDCRPEFMRSFQKTLALGTKAGVQGRAPKIWAPLQRLSKAQIVQIGARLGLDFSLTRSCYDPDEQGRPCGECDSCRLRRKGFQEAGVRDPLIEKAWAAKRGR